MFKIRKKIQWNKKICLYNLKAINSICAKRFYSQKGLSNSFV